MAIIRIVINVLQQQIRKDYSSSTTYTLNSRFRAQRTEQMSQQNNHRNPENSSNGSPRHTSSRQHRGQIFLHQDALNDPLSGLIPREIQPIIEELEQQNNQNLANVNSPSLYLPINQGNLSVNLVQIQKQKQLVYEKLIIYGIVWHKEINSLFDYEEREKNTKSHIIIQNDVKACINFFQSHNQSLQVKKTDVYLNMFKRKDRTMYYERIQLKDIDVPALRRHVRIPPPQVNGKRQQQVNPEERMEKEFVCSLKVILNTMTNTFSIKVYSLDEIAQHVKLVTLSNKNHSQNNTSIVTQKQHTILPPIQSTHNSLDPYFIIRTLSKTDPSESLGCKLYPGTMIKLGKVQFKVMSIDGQMLESNSSEYDRRAIEVTQIDEETQKEIECKYCLGGKSDKEDNFFLHLCDCKGHIGYVHYDCLTTWTTTKASIQTADNVKMYFLEKTKCQVCLKEFPKYFRYNGKLYHMLPIELPEHHIMLVDISGRQQAITAVISGNSDKQTLIGRGRAANLRVSDITVSREHAIIQRINDQYYIKDNKSKFGTLIRSSEEELEISGIQHKKGFQLGNVIFTVQVMAKEVEKDKNREKEEINIAREYRRAREVADMSRVTVEVQNNQENKNQYNQENEQIPEEKSQIREQNIKQQICQINEQNIIEQQNEQQTRSTKKCMSSTQSKAPVSTKSKKFSKANKLSQQFSHKVNIVQGQEVDQNSGHRECRFSPYADENEEAENFNSNNQQ